jgi:hypothetical protein
MARVAFLILAFFLGCAWLFGRFALHQGGIFNVLLFMAVLALFVHAAITGKRV